MRRFLLVRAEDVSGVSGTGVIAEGVVFGSGKAVLSWRSEFPALSIFDAVDDVETVHGHEGRTWIQWIDPPEAAASQQSPAAS
jgi:hypothetical protein